MQVICQLGAVCLKYCTHKWPHEPTTTLSCAQEGCSCSDMRVAYGIKDEFGEQFTKHTINPAYCVDFEYFLANTGHGHMIVTKGTVFEGWHERANAYAIKEENERHLRMERRRKERIAMEMDWRFRQAYIRNELNHAHNPSLIKEEDRWIGRNYRGWG